MGEDHGDGRDRQRLTVPEAATVLEVTVDAVRGRVRRGTIDHERDETGKVHVWVDVSGAPGGAASRRPSPTVEGPSTASQSRSAEHDQLVESLLDQVKYMREQLAAEREANRENRRIIAGLIQRVPELETAPRDEPHGPETPVETSEGVDAPTGQVDRETGVQRRRASWWRRFFGFE